MSRTVYDWDKEKRTWRVKPKQALAAVPGGPRPGNWPIVSDAAGVHPEQVPEAHAEARRLGYAVDFKKDGSAIFDSPGQRKAYCRAIGLHDRKGGYGDP